MKMMPLLRTKHANCTHFRLLAVAFSSTFRLMHSIQSMIDGPKVEKQIRKDFWNFKQFFFDGFYLLHHPSEGSGK
jgi:hypothetical protein